FSGHPRDVPLRGGPGLDEPLRSTAAGVLPGHADQERLGHADVRPVRRGPVRPCRSRDPRKHGRRLVAPPPDAARSAGATSEPTDQKLRKAREEGNVAKSKDFTETVLMGGLLTYTLLAGPELVRTLTEIMLLPAQLYGMPFRDALALLVVAVLKKSVDLLLPFL